MVGGVETWCRSIALQFSRSVLTGGDDVKYNSDGDDVDNLNVDKTAFGSSRGVAVLASSLPVAARDGTDAGEARSHPPDSQLKPGSHASRRLRSGLVMPFRMTFIRLKSMGFSIQPSIPSDSIYSR